MNDESGPGTEGVEAAYRSDFAVGEHSARHLRRILRLYLVGRGLHDVVDAAELALTELIANVVRHVPGRRCQTCIVLQPDRVRVEVTDGCPRLPTAVVGDELDEGGRGLVLVAAVTDNWGVEPRRDGRGKTVWFECLAGKGADA
ncbi:MAG TPA: ATP-binding protein [Streptomyces sp.]